MSDEDEREFQCSACRWSESGDVWRVVTDARVHASAEGHDMRVSRYIDVRRLRAERDDALAEAERLRENANLLYDVLAELFGHTHPSRIPSYIADETRTALEATKEHSAGLRAVVSVSQKPGGPSA